MDFKEWIEAFGKINQKIIERDSTTAVEISLNSIYPPKYLETDMLIAPIKQPEGVNTYVICSPDAFHNYVQLKSGLVIPKRIAMEFNIDFVNYKPKENMHLLQGADLDRESILDLTK